MADNLLTLKPEAETIKSSSDSTTSPAVNGNPFVLAWHVQLFYAAAFVAMVVVAVGGNAVVVWIVVAHRRMRSVTNYFLVNLSLADGFQSIFHASEMALNSTLALLLSSPSSTRCSTSSTCFTTTGSSATRAASSRSLAHPVHCLPACSPSSQSPLIGGSRVFRVFVFIS